MVWVIGMEIRKMTVADWQESYILWKNCDGVGIREKDDSQSGFERFLKRNPNTCFAAVDSGGTVCATVLASNDGRRGYIYHLAVAPEYRNKGLGSALVERALHSLKECGIEKAALVVYKDNKSGNAFWERHGFQIRSDLLYRDMDLGDGNGL